MWKRFVLELHGEWSELDECIGLKSSIETKLPGYRLFSQDQHARYELWLDAGKDGGGGLRWSPGPSGERGGDDFTGAAWAD